MFRLTIASTRPVSVRRATRRLVHLFFTIAVLLSGVRGVHAQATHDSPTPPRATTTTTGWQFLVAQGSAIPTGPEKQVIARGNLTAAQVSYVVRPAFAVTASAGWARSRDLSTNADRRIDIFTYDAGGEVRGPRWNREGKVSIGALAGAGIGGRSYNYRGGQDDATTRASVYVSAGGEFGVGRVRLRLEVRDNLARVAPFGGGPRGVRHDVTILTGLRIVR